MDKQEKKTTLDKLVEALSGYFCQYTFDYDGNNLLLIDLLSPGKTIAEGKLEIVHLVEYIMDELNALVRAINSLVGEDEIGCECDCCRGDHARIAKWVIFDYISENVTDYKNEPVILGDVIDWLNKESE